ncbi:MAG: hypothetical protein JST54_06295 [Deltaproteobacteria bacterium]|nr:hypothetical protein [Deltaproteobacteria bacterium]
MIAWMLAAALGAAPAARTLDLEMENVPLPAVLDELAHATGWRCTAARGSKLTLHIQARDVSKDELLLGVQQALTESGFEVVQQGASCMVVQQAGKPHARSVQLARLNGKWLVRPGPAQ